jgi:Fe2+ transport system protein B
MNEFFLGATGTGCVVVALFFVRFWRDTGDRFFALFALAFATFAANRVVLALLDEQDEHRTIAYAVRLLAFLLIIVAIVDKNRPGPAPRRR